jgi:hypothetical protein
LTDPNTANALALKILDFILTGVFTVEAIIKIIAYGAYFCGEQSYLRSYINIMDLGVIIVTVSNMILMTFICRLFLILLLGT